MEQTIGKRIVQNRKRLGLTQDQLAEKLGVTAQAVSKWENDQSCPDITLLSQLADIFGISTDELLGHKQEKVYVAEPVDDEEKETMKFTYDAGRKGTVGFALFVLLTGGLFLAAQLMEIGASFWSILWPTALLVFGAMGLFPRFSFFRLFCAVVGGWFLANIFLPISFKPSAGIVWAIILILFGLSLLVDGAKKPKGHKLRFKKGLGKGNRNAPTEEYTEEEDLFRFDASFGEGTKFVCLPVLRRGEVSVSFGDYVIDLSNVESVDNCVMNVNCSFGHLQILVPERFAVKTDSSTAFAGFSVSGSPRNTPEGIIRLNASCSFGEITVEYV